MEQEAITRAKNIVGAYVDELHKGETPLPYEVLIVWFCKTLKNWKAIVITTLHDQVLYEVTHNGEKDETYLDVYEKHENRVIPGNRES
jgi:hypothetical protein